jgi:hypothetical protein
MGRDTFQLFSSLPTVREGIARVLDLGGQTIDHGYIMCETPLEADRRALASDWSAVLNDLNWSIKQLGQQQTHGSEDVDAR